jgi:hypothetical protein
MPASVGSFLGLLYDLDDGGNIPPKYWDLSELHSVTIQKDVEK